MSPTMSVMSFLYPCSLHLRQRLLKDIRAIRNVIPGKRRRREPGTSNHRPSVCGSRVPSRANPGPGMTTESKTLLGCDAQATRGFPHQVVDDLGDRRARQEHLGDALRLQLRDVLLRNDAAGDDADVARAALVEQAAAFSAAGSGARPTGCSPRSSRRPPRSPRAPPPRWSAAGRYRSPPCRHRAARAPPRARRRRDRRGRPWRSTRGSCGAAAPATVTAFIRSPSTARSCRTGAARSRRSRPRWHRRAPPRARSAPRCGPPPRRGRPRPAPPARAPGRGRP